MKLGNMVIRIGIPLIRILRLRLEFHQRLFYKKILLISLITTSKDKELFANVPCLSLTVSNGVLIVFLKLFRYSDFIALHDTQFSKFKKFLIIKKNPFILILFKIP